jgi:hypothetical protein
MESRIVSRLIQAGALRLAAFAAAMWIASEVTSALAPLVAVARALHGVGQ